MRSHRSKFFAATWCVLALYASIVSGTTLRIVCYNLECAGEASNNNITGPTHSIPTVVQAIGLHHLGNNAQQVDVLGLEELLSTTLSPLTAQLNAIYGAGTYAYDTTHDTSTGGGADGLIYNTRTIQVVSVRVLHIGQNVLLQANGTYVAASSPGGGTNGVTRAPLCYRLHPIGYPSSTDFYVYEHHARSSTDDTLGDARYAEAQEVRSDAKYNLPGGAHIIYMGDWNLFKGSAENAYKCLTGQVTSDGIDWSDLSAIWANQNPTQAYDPISRTTPPTIFIWGNVAADNASYIYSWSTAGLTSRLDLQLVNQPMLAAYNSQGGVELAPDTSDPFDSANFPSTRYPYALEAFGNNGTTPRNSVATSSSNHSLDDLTATTPNAATVYADLKVTGSGEAFTGSDHYPIVADYNIVPPPIFLVAQSLSTSGYFRIDITSTPNTLLTIQASINLVDWTTIGSGTTDANGLLLFQDTTAGSFPARFYHAVWP